VKRLVIHTVFSPHTSQLARERLKLAA